MRILIVDESMVARQAIKRALNGIGLERGDCVEASDGTTALELVSSMRFDCAIVPLGMAGIDGLAFTKAVRTRVGGARLPIVVTAEEVTVGDVAMAIQAGADDIVAMPFRSDQLRRKVRALLGDAAYGRERQIIYNLARPSFGRRAVAL